MGSAPYHESYELLSEQTRELHRGIVSLIEELEAVDWYQQRFEACSDAELKAILAHNRDEEIEHACMALEWIRRRSATFDAQLRRYVFSSGSIAEKESDKAEPAASGASGCLALGSLKDKANGSSQT